MANPFTPLLDRLRQRERGTALLLALAVEALLVLAVLSLGLVEPKPRQRPGATLVSVAISPPAPEPDRAAARAKAAPAALAPSQPRPALATPPVPAPVSPASPMPTIIPLSKNQMAALDISNLPRQPAPGAAPARGLMGPVDAGVPGDSRRVGSAPNGQPMYAAAWYREPYDSELSGYLATAQGPGWALIACRTVPDFKVDDCVGLREYPEGSNLLRAVLAAAWQFKVRPPRVGGVSQVGAWVRIRIDYTERRE